MEATPSTHVADHLDGDTLVLKPLDGGEEVHVSQEKLAQGFTVEGLRKLVQVGAKFFLDPENGKWR